jgi:pentatricopeptide repeat protein
MQYNAVMSACVRGGKPEQALVLYERMQDQGERDTDSMGRGSGLVRDDYSYGYDDWFIDPYYVFLFPSQFDLCLPPYGIIFIIFSTLTKSTCRVAMSAMAQTGRWADAHKLLNNLPSKLQKSTILCNTVLGALSAAGQFDLVRELFESMRTEGPAPDKVTFYTVVAALEKAGDLKEAANLRSEMGLRPVASAVVASASELSPSVSAAQRDRRTSKSPVDEAAIEKRNRNTTPDVAGPHWATDGDELDEDGSDGKSDKKLLTLSHEELEAFLRSYSPAGTLEEKLLAQGRIRESPLTADGAIGSNYDTSANTGTGSVSRWEGGGAGVASLMKLLGMSGKTAQVIELLRRVEEEDRRDSGNSNYECTVPIAVYNAASKLFDWILSFVPYVLYAIIYCMNHSYCLILVYCIFLLNCLTVSACAQSDDWRRALEAYAAMTIEDNTDSLLDLKAAVTLKVPRNRRTYESLLPALEKAAAGGGDGDGDPEAANFLLAVKERARLEGLC